MTETEREMSTPKRKHVSLTFANKIEIIDKVRGGEPRQAVINQHKISMRTLERILAKETEIRELSQQENASSRKKKTRREE